MNAIQSVEQFAQGNESTAEEIARIFAPSRHTPTRLVYSFFIDAAILSLYVEYRAIPKGSRPGPFLVREKDSLEAGIGGFYGCVERTRGRKRG